MHQLILFRHAKAVGEGFGVVDHDRALAPEGRRAAAAMGAAMRDAGLCPDVILVSPALRTQQTLEALEPWGDAPNIETIPGLYMATAAQIRQCLLALPETVRSAMVIGHNPGLHELAMSLAGPLSGRTNLTRISQSYPTAALSEFLVTTAWRKLAPGAAALQRFLQPADLSR